MIPKLVYTPRDPCAFPNWQFENLDFTFDVETASAWMSFKADGPPCFTFQTLTDMADVRESLIALHAAVGPERFPVRYVVLASNKPGLFNLGGDLATFARNIREREIDLLRAYAHACIDVVYGMATAYDLPVITVSAVTGQALGGGMESALAQDYLVVDAAAQLGVPEVAFNTFPGMGAVTLLTRRLGAAQAGALIGSGEVLCGAEAFAMGVADRLAPAGHLRPFILDWMREGGDAVFARRLAITAARRRAFPIRREELMRIVDLWTDCCAGVSQRDLRHMEKLVSAQRRMAA